MRAVKATMAMLTVLLSSMPISADTLEAFLKRSALSDVTSGMFHNAGRHIVLVGNETMSMDKSQVMAIHKKIKAMGAKTEIIDLKIVNKYETGDIISIVMKARIKQTVGSTQAISEVISHEILMKKKEQYISVFSLSRQ